MFCCNCFVCKYLAICVELSVWLIFIKLKIFELMGDNKMESLLHYLEMNVMIQMLVIFIFEVMVNKSKTILRVMNQLGWNVAA